MRRRARRRRRRRRSTRQRSRRRRARNTRAIRRRARKCRRRSRGRGYTTPRRGSPRRDSSRWRSGRSRRVARRRRRRRSNRRRRRRLRDPQRRRWRGVSPRPRRRRLEEDERHRAVSRIGDHGDGENALGVRDARGVLHRGRWFEVRHPRESHRALGIGTVTTRRSSAPTATAVARAIVPSSPSPRASVAARDVTLLEAIASWVACRWRRARASRRVPGRVSESSRRDLSRRETPRPRRIREAPRVPWLS